MKLPAFACRRQAQAGPFDKAQGPEQVEGLPGRVLSFIVPLDPAGHFPVSGIIPSFSSGVKNPIHDIVSLHAPMDGGGSR